MDAGYNHFGFNRAQEAIGVSANLVVFLSSNFIVTLQMEEEYSTLNLPKPKPKAKPKSNYAQQVSALWCRQFKCNTVEKGHSE